MRRKRLWFFVVKCCSVLIVYVGFLLSLNDEVCIVFFCSRVSLIIVKCEIVGVK